MRTKKIRSETDRIGASNVKCDSAHLIVPIGFSKELRRATAKAKTKTATPVTFNQHQNDVYLCLHLAGAAAIVD